MSCLGFKGFKNCCYVALQASVSGNLYWGGLSGQRSKQGGRLQLGTEVVASKDGSLAALLGASPGASTAVTIMLEVLQRCFKDRLASAPWQERLRALLPSIGGDPVRDPDLLLAMRQRSDALLGLTG